MPKTLKIFGLYFILLLGVFGYGQEIPKQIFAKTSLANQTLLSSLAAGDRFSANDFEVTVLEVLGSGGTFTGSGYIGVPYIENIRLAVNFENIKINTDFQLIDGTVQTAYDPSWKNVGAIDPLIEEIFGPQTGEETPSTTSDSETEATATTTNEETKTTETKDEVKENNNTSQTTPTNATETKDNTKTESTNTNETNNTNTETTTSQNNNSNSGGNPDTKTPEKEKEVTAFALTALTVKQASNTARIAKEGETLYFVNKPTFKDEKYKIIFEQVIKPNLEISKDYLKWSSGGKDLVQYAGKKVIGDDPMKPFFTNETKNFTMTATTGYPNSTSKNVDVKWVDEKLTKIDIVKKMGPILKIFDEINYWQSKFKSYGIPCKVAVLDNLERAIQNNKFSLSYEKKNEEDNKSRYYNELDKFKFSASGAEMFNLSCGKDVEIPIPFTSKKIPIVSANFGVSAGLKGSIEIIKERQIETNKTSYNKSKVSGNGYATPFISASIVGVQGKVDMETGIKFEYPYKSNPLQVGIIFYTSDITGKVEISKDANVFVTESFSYQLFKLDTKNEIEVFKIDLNTLTK